MTIKELCDKQEYCKLCPFHDACDFLYWNAPFRKDEEVNKAITSSIIETAKRLTESEVNNNG